MTVSPTARRLRDVGLLHGARHRNGRHLSLRRLRARVAVGKTVILLHPHLPLVGVSIVIERERQ